MELKELDARALLTAGVDLVALRYTYLNSPSAAILLKLFSQRDKASKLTKLLRAHALVAANTPRDFNPPTFRDIETIFYGLRNANCGTLIGPGAVSDSIAGHPYIRYDHEGFLWNAHLVTVGRFAVNGVSPEILDRITEKLRPATRIRRGLLISTIPPASTPKSGSLIPLFTSVSHSFRLRPDSSINLTLPQDFTSAEAKRLAAFIKTLPLDSANRKISL